MVVIFFIYWVSLVSSVQEYENTITLLHGLLGY